MGRSSNPKINHLVIQEAAVHKDIVIGNFNDTFQNLYKKMILSITWPLERNCRASYILKTDDDCFVNVGNLLHWLNSQHTMNSTQPIYAGRVQEENLVIRDKTSRYYVSKSNHPKPFYSPYVSGGGYVFSANLLPLLSKFAETSPLFPNEDALLGSLMLRIGVKPIDNAKFLPLIFCVTPSQSKLKEMNMCALSRQIILHGVRGVQQLRMHFNNALLNSLSSLCTRESSYENIRDQCHVYETEDGIGHLFENKGTPRKILPS